MNYNGICRQLHERYPDGEARAIAKYLLEVAFGMSSADIYCGGVDALGDDEQRRLSSMMKRLVEGEPVQYVTGLADFHGRMFDVATGVLIPRPETEELCSWIIEDVGTSTLNPQPSTLSILDIGTGSGCIAVTLALEIDKAKVEAWDIADETLLTAKRNSEKHRANIIYNKVDALSPPPDADKWDAIVSNPPYVCEQEKAAMDCNVLDYEPHIALFVPDSNPLLFYRSIAKYSVTALKSGGALYFEINPSYAKDIVNMLESLGFSNVEIRIDQYGKPRMAKAVRP